MLNALRPTKWSRPAGACLLALIATGCGLFAPSRSEEEAGGDASAVVSSRPDEVSPAPESTPTAAEGSGLADEGAQRVDVLARRAADAEKRGDLAEARDLWGEILAIDPRNPDAREAFERLGAVLGATAQEAGGAEDVAADAAERARIREQQLAVELEERVKAGDFAMEQGKFEDAIAAYEDALTILRWNPRLEGRPFTEESLRERLETAKERKVELERAEEQARQARILREKEEREAAARARLENRIRTLFEAADRAFNDDRFAEAASYLEEILRIDPANAEARRFLHIAREADRDATDRELRRSYKENWRRTFDEMAAELRPQNDLVVFPDEKTWRRIAEQGPIEFSVEEETMSAEERQILQKLESVPMNLTFSDTSLSEAVDWIKTMTGVNIIVSPTIIESGDEPLYTITAGPMPAKEALELLLELSTTPLTYRIRDGVVQILTKEEAVGGQILEIYDIRDLAKIISNFPAKDFNLTPSGYEPEEFGEEGEEPQPLVLEADRLADLIRTNIDPESWDLDPNNSIQAVSGALVVRQSPEVHRLIRDLLQDLRENTGTLINIEARFLTVSDTFLEDIGVDFRGLGPDTVNPAAQIPSGLVLDEFGSVPEGFGTPLNPSGVGTDNDVGIFYDGGGLDEVRARVENLYDVTLGNDEFTNSGGLSVQATFLDNTLVEAILRAVSKYGTANLVDAPSLTVHNGQRAHLSVINHFSYVKDFDTEIAQAAVIAQPVVDILQDGVILDVKPVVSSDKRFVTMELRPTVAQLKRPLDTFTTSLAIGSDVTIELPQLEIQRARTTVTVPDGATIMLGGWKVNVDRDLVSGVPFLMHIPGLSAIFSRKGKFLEKKKLLILVRAKIVIPEESEPVAAATAGR